MAALAAKPSPLAELEAVLAMPDGLPHECVALSGGL